jgi:hypothetical protein
MTDFLLHSTTPLAASLSGSSLECVEIFIEVVTFLYFGIY